MSMHPAFPFHRARPQAFSYVVGTQRKMDISLCGPWTSSGIGIDACQRSPPERMWRNEVVTNDPSGINFQAKYSTVTQGTNSEPSHRQIQSVMSPYDEAQRVTSPVSKGHLRPDTSRVACTASKSPAIKKKEFQIPIHSFDHSRGA